MIILSWFHRGIRSLCCFQAWLNPAPYNPIRHGVCGPLQNHWSAFGDIYQLSGTWMAQKSISLEKKIVVSVTWLTIVLKPSLTPKHHPKDPCPPELCSFSCWPLSRAVREAICPCLLPWCPGGRPSPPPPWPLTTSSYRPWYRQGGQSPEGGRGKE